MKRSAINSVYPASRGQFIDEVSTAGDDLRDKFFVSPGIKDDACGSASLISV